MSAGRHPRSGLRLRMADQRRAGPPGLLTAWALLAILGTGGCSTQTRAAPRPSLAPSQPVQPSKATALPAIGRIDGLDYPGLHIGQPRSAWGSVQAGVNIIVFSGTGEAYDEKGDYYGAAEICSVTAVDQPVRRRDLEHCYFDKRDRHSYRTTGQDGFLTRLERDDGRRFTFDLRDGKLMPRRATSRPRA